MTVRPTITSRFLPAGRIFGVAALAMVMAGCNPLARTLPPEKRIRAGWDNYRLGEFSLALKDFQAVVEASAPGSDLHLAALYGEATTWRLRRPDEDLEQAARLYQRVIELAPTNSLAAWSWLALARIQSLPLDGQPAPLARQEQAYREVISRFPFHPAGEEAFLMMQAARLADSSAGLAARVREEITAFLETHGGSGWRSAANTLLSHCCLVMGDGEARLAAVMSAWKTGEMDPSNPVQDRSWTYWQLATVAEFEAGDFATAREYYRKLMEEYPTEQKVFLARQELQRMDELEARLRSERQRP